MTDKMTDMQESGNGSLMSSTRMNEVRENVQGLMNSRQISDALDRLRSLLDQTSQVLRDLGQQSGEWTQTAQTRASEMARQLRDQTRQLRDQSGVAVDRVSRQVEQNPKASVGVAFGAALAIGILTGALLFRR
jgi:ElaB/YqjD/DUF883 family membrane-anchored ribosome-binding protein